MQVKVSEKSIFRSHGDKRLCIRNEEIMVLPFCEVRRCSLGAGPQPSVVRVKAEECTHPLFRICMASKREEQREQVNSIEGPQVRLEALLQETSLAHLAEAWPV